jgi:hypothetical protein
MMKANEINVNRSKTGKLGTLGERGQSTLEFVLTLTLILGFSLFFIQASLVFAYGNYVHYATFMSARAYLSAGPTREDQVMRARSVIVRMLKRSEAEAGVDRFAAIARGVGGSNPPGFEVNPPPQFDPTKRDFSWLEGVRYTFRSRMFVIPLGGRSSVGKGASGNDGNSANSLTLTSESWLGRETTTEECIGEMEKRKGTYDNGC